MTTILSINLTASILILGIVLFRALALCRFPRKLFLLLWGIVALRLLIPVSLPVYLPDDFGQTPAQVEVSNVPAYGEIITVPNTAPSAQVAPATFEFPYEAIWLIGVCAVAIFFLISYIRFRKVFQASETCENEAVNHWLVTLPLRRSVQVRQSGEIGSPLTYGIFRPVILLPSDMDLSDEKKLYFILTHEAVHIRRFDAALKLLLTVVVCLHWFNPLVWVLYVLANRDIELSCDEAVVKQSGYETRSEYAHILIGLVETRSRRAFPLVSYFGKHAEEERITSLMKVKKYSVPVIVAAVAVLLCCGALAAFAISPDSPADYEYEAAYPENILSGDKDLAYIHALQNRLGEVIGEYAGVKEAAVIITDGKNSIPLASVMVTMEDESMGLSNEQATAIRRLVKNSVNGLTEENISIADDRGTFYEMQVSLPDGYEEIYNDGQINYDNERVSSETIVRTPTETELKVMSQLKDKLNTFSDVEVIAIAAQTNDKGKITVDIKLEKGNDLTDEQLRELMDLFYSIVPIEQAGQLGVSAIVSEEVIPAGELGSQTYEPSYILPGDFGGVVGVEGNEDIPDYVEDDGGQEVHVSGQSNYDPVHPSWSDDEEKPVPITHIRSFERRYSNEYLLIDEVEFSLTADNPSAVYEGSSDKDVVISFVDNGPVTCIVSIAGTDSAGTYKCGFAGESAVRIKLAVGASYKVEYQLGVKTNSSGTPGYLEETVDASSGIIKVYEKK